MSEPSMVGHAVSLNGSEIGEMPIVKITVEQSVRLPDLFSIEILDPGFGVLDTDHLQIGGKIDISLYGSDDLSLVTSGEITSLTHDGRRLVVQGFDPAHRLHRGPRTTTYIQMTDSDIATKIAREHSLTADVDGTSEVHPYVVQFSQSDYTFLRARAERIGFDLWVADDTLHFKRKADVETVAGLRWKENLLDLRVRFSAAERSDEVVVKGWDYLEKEAIEGRSSERDTGTSAAAAGDIASQARQAFGSVTRTLADRPFATQSEADELAKSLALLASGGEVTLRGVCRGDSSIRAGGNVDIAGIGDRMSGEYHVTAVVHTVGQDEGYRTRFVAGPKDSAAFTDLVGGNGLALSLGQSAVGPVFAKVTDNADPENTGRVKVEFGHLRGTESTWAPVVSPGAGADRGVQFLPEIGDQVVVIFERNDPAHPIVIGGIWNRQDGLADPEAASNGDVRTRILRSREGHRLLFDDQGPGRLQLSLGDDSCGVHLEGSESRVTGDQKLTIEASAIEVVAGGKLTLKGAQIEIDASADVTVSGAIIKLN